MTLGNDFLNLISLMWDIERFNMWIPRQHGSVAYLLDRLILTDRYQQTYDELYALAKNGEADEFAMRATIVIMELSKADSRYSDEDMAYMERWLERQKEAYEEKRMTGVAAVRDQYIPDWFFELFHGYIKLEEIKRETDVITYFQSEGNMTREQSIAAYEELYEDCYDILNELHFFIKNGRFKAFNPTTAKKISAKQLYETICETPLEAYLFLVRLRKEPDKALLEYNERIAESKK